jgi:hypothetical protein
MVSLILEDAGHAVQETGGRSQRTRRAAYEFADPALAARCVLVCMAAGAVHLSPEVAALLEAHGIPVLAKSFEIEGLLAVVAAAADVFPEYGPSRLARPM